MSLRARKPTASEAEMVEKALVFARTKAPYYSRALAALTPRAVDGLGTVAVDRYWRLYFDPAWFEAQPPTIRAGVLWAHEVEHLLRDHMGRVPMKGVDNLAGDLEIDDDAPEGVLPDFAYTRHEDCGVPRYLLMEDYRSLLQDQVEVCTTCQGGSGAGAAPGSWELPKDSAPAVTDSLTLREAVAHDVRARAAAGKPVPESVLIWADAIAKPVQIHWTMRLNSVVRQAVQTAFGRDDWSRARVHRRQQLGMPLRPAPVRHDPVIEVIVDTSGSMVADGSTVLGVVESLCRRYGQVTVTSADTEERGRTHGRRHAFAGGGGTDLTEPILAAAARRPSVVVVITDCETPWPDACSVPVLVVSTSIGSGPAWATTIHVA